MQQTREGQAELSVVVPLYNEEESLPQLVEQLLAALRPLQLGFELVLVDDGSRDDTAKVLSKLAGQVLGRGCPMDWGAKTVTCPPLWR